MGTRYLRFLHPKPSLTKWDLAYLTEIDYVDHFAWGIELVDDPGHLGIGIARYIRDKTDSTVAEVAITVVDEYQRRGLGRLLLEALVEAAREHGVERFRAQVSASNDQVIKSLTRLGATSSRVEDSEICLEMALPTRAFHTSAMYQALRAVGSHQALLNQDTNPWQPCEWVMRVTHFTVHSHQPSARRRRAEGRERRFGDRPIPIQCPPKLVTFAE
jgi:GNAT superfamily N-acetyltransferase